MSGGFLLDTNVVSELTKTRIEPKVQSWIATQRLGSLSISVVNIGEMAKGFTTMADQQRRSRLESWLERKLIDLFRGQVLPVTQANRQALGSVRRVAPDGRPPPCRARRYVAATVFDMTWPWSRAM